MTPVNKENLRYSISFYAIIKGFFFSLVISLVLSIGTGAVYYLSSVSEKTLPWIAVSILALSCFGGSFAAGRDAGNRGLYHGLAVGFVFFIIVWLAAGFVMPGQAIIGMFYKFVIALLAGALGGIVGVGVS